MNCAACVPEVLAEDRLRFRLEWAVGCVGEGARSGTVPRRVGHDVAQGCGDGGQPVNWCVVLVLRECASGFPCGSACGPREAGSTESTRPPYESATGHSVRGDTIRDDALPSPCSRPLAGSASISPAAGAPRAVCPRRGTAARVRRPSPRPGRRVTFRPIFLADTSRASSPCVGAAEQTAECGRSAPTATLLLLGGDEGGSRRLGSAPDSGRDSCASVMAGAGSPSLHSCASRRSATGWIRFLEEVAGSADEQRDRQVIGPRLAEAC
jgi:hypothetical protein